MKPFFTAWLALVFFAVQDILIWQRIFETHEMWEFVNQYHLGWFVSLAGYIALGVLLFQTWKDRLIYAVCLFALALNGIEDVLYYWLDARALPAFLPWLNQNPLILFRPVTDTGLVANCAIWLIVMVLGLVFVEKRRRSL